MKKCSEGLLPIRAMQNRNEKSGNPLRLPLTALLAKDRKNKWTIQSRYSFGGGTRIGRVRCVKSGR
jgi:hypothetical protein